MGAERNCDAKLRDAEIRLNLYWECNLRLCSYSTLLVIRH